MKKVGLLTCFLDNCGACLQAYALQETIDSFGCTCYIVKYVEPDGYDKRKWPRKVISETVRNPYVLKLLSFVSPAFKERYFGKIRHLRFVRFRKKMLHFTKRTFFAFQELVDYNFDFDYFVAGSDQIWNPTFYSGNNRAYFLDFVPHNTPRIAYAPSIGISAMPLEYADDFSHLINQFSYLSAREAKGVDIISKYTSKKCQLVCDPTLLLTGEQWANSFHIHPQKQNYILLYLFGEREYYKKFIQKAREELGLNVVCIPFTDGDRAESSYLHINDAGPVEFLQLISCASLVITDSFHATVFSLLFRIPFYTFLRNQTSDPKNMNERIFSLLNVVCLSNRVVTDFDPSFRLSTTLNFDNADEKLKDFRLSSLEYLKKALDL